MHRGTAPDFYFAAARSEVLCRICFRGAGGAEIPGGFSGAGSRPGRASMQNTLLRHYFAPAAPAFSGQPAQESGQDYLSPRVWLAALPDLFSAAPGSGQGHVVNGNPGNNPGVPGFFTARKTRNFWVFSG